MVLLCKCGSADVVEPKLTGGRAPVPELMESAAPEDDGEEVKVEKKIRRKSMVKRAYEGAKRRSAQKSEALQRGANSVSVQTQHFMALRGWVGSITVTVGMGVVKVGVTLPVRGRVYFFESGGAPLFGDFSNLFEWDGEGEEPDKAEEKSKIPKALERMAGMLVGAKRSWPGGCVEGAAVTVCVDLTCYGVGIEIEAEIDVFSIVLPEDQTAGAEFWLCGSGGVAAE